MAKHLRGSVAQSPLSFTRKQGCPSLLTISSRPPLVLLGAPLIAYYSSLPLFFTCKESCLICELDTCCVRLGHSTSLISQAFSVLSETGRLVEGDLGKWPPKHEEGLTTAPAH